MQACENRAPAVHTATQPFLEEQRVKAEFLFDFGSPNAYIAHTQVPGIESRTGVTVEYVPVLLGGVFKLVGNVSPVEAFKPIPAKLEYFRQDIRDWVEYLGIPYRRNPHFPVMTLGIMRGAVAVLGTDRFADYVETVFRAMWVEEKKMDDPAVIAEVLTAAGFDAETIFARTQGAGGQAQAHRPHPGGGGPGRVRLPRLLRRGPAVLRQGPHAPLRGRAHGREAVPGPDPGPVIGAGPAAPELDTGTRLSSVFSGNGDGIAGGAPIRSAFPRRCTARRWCRHD